eukprot:1809910-Amphidinium_carterae.1
MNGEERAHIFWGSLVVAGVIQICAHTVETKMGTFLPQYHARMLGFWNISISAENYWGKTITQISN